MRLGDGNTPRPRRGNGVWCPKCPSQVIAIDARTGEVTLTEGSKVIHGPAGPLGDWIVACPHGHRFRVANAFRRKTR